MIAQVQYSSGENLTMDPAVMISTWEFTKQPVRRRTNLEKRTEKLCITLEKIPELTIHCEKFTGPVEESEINRDQLKQLLELVNSNLLSLNGDTIQTILRHTSVYVPKLSKRLRYAIKAARERMEEARHALMYALDIVLEEEDEWLQGPPEPGAFPRGQDAIPFDQI